MSDFSVQTSRKTIILRSMGTLIALALLVYLLSQQGWGEISAAIQQIPLWRLALALILMIISRLAVSARWHILLRSSQVPISFRQTLSINFAGLFASNFLPTTIGGDVVRLAGAIQLKFDVVVCAASLLVDRLVGMAGMAMAVPFSISSVFSNRPATVLPLFSISLLPRSLQKGTQRLWEKGMGIFHKILAALRLWLKQPDSLLIALIFSWVHMLCLFSILQLLLEGMGDHLSIWLIGGLYSLVYFVTLIPISINGYGVQEISMTFVLSTWGKASLNSALTAALLFRTLMMVASLPGAIFVPGMLSSSSSAPEGTLNTKDPGSPASK